MKRKRYQAFISTNGRVDRDAIGPLLDEIMTVRTVPMPGNGRYGVRLIAELALHDLTYHDRGILAPILDHCEDYLPDRRDTLQFYTHATAIPLSMEAIRDPVQQRKAISALRRSVTEDILEGARQLRRELAAAAVPSNETHRAVEKPAAFSIKGLFRTLNSSGAKTSTMSSAFSGR